MILSMTGYGRGTAGNTTRTVTVEIKTLNSKQLDLQVRLPQNMREMELDLRAIVAERLERGKTEMNICEEMIGAQSHSTFDGNTMAAYKAQIENISNEYGIPSPLPADWYSLLMRLPNVLKPSVSAITDDDRKIVTEAMSEALDSLCAYRLAEGKKLYNFFIEKINALFCLLDEIEADERERVPRIKAKLSEQLSKLDIVEFDSGRLEQELIYYIEKLDVTEEKTRLRAHMNYFLETMGPEDEGAGKGCGKKLGFIAQEMGREINTLGSKSNHAGMQRTVVRMKDELEQIKEQVLNVL